MDVTLSIIVPAYNVVDTLESCIVSIMESSYQDFEVLLVDDGSTDGTSVLCNQLAERYNKIKVFHTENHGLSMARNLGIENALGEWITFVDSDDLVAPNMYELLVKETDEDVQLVCCRYVKCKRENVALVQRSGEVSVRIGEQIAEKILCGGYAPYVWNKLFRRRILEENGIWFKPGLIMEDQFFIADYLRVCHKAVFCDEALYYYIDSPGSITNTFRENRIVSDRYVDMPRGHAYTARILEELGYPVYKWSRSRAVMFYQTVLRKSEKPNEEYIQEVISYVKQHKNTLLHYSWGIKYYLSALVLCTSYPLWAKIFRRGI